MMMNMQENVEPEEVTVVEGRKSVRVISWGSSPFARVEGKSGSSSIIPNGFTVQSFAAGKEWVGEARVVDPTNVLYQFRWSKDERVCSKWNASATGAFADVNARMQNAKFVKGTGGPLLIGVTYPRVQAIIGHRFRSEIQENFPGYEIPLPPADIKVGARSRRLQEGTRGTLMAIANPQTPEPQLALDPNSIEPVQKKRVARSLRSRKRVKMESSDEEEDDVEWLPKGSSSTSASAFVPLPTPKVLQHFGEMDPITSGDIKCPQEPQEARPCLEPLGLIDENSRFSTMSFFVGEDKFVEDDTVPWLDLDPETVEFDMSTL